MRQDGDLQAVRVLVVSSVPGRVRLRGAALRDAKALARVCKAVHGCEGVLECRANARVGSVLLRYEPQRLPLPELLARLAGALPPAARDAADAADAPVSMVARKRAQARARRRLNLAAEYGMLFSLGASLLAVAGGGRRGQARSTHTFWGSVFLVLLAQHIYTWRRTLLRPLRPEARR